MPRTDRLATSWHRGLLTAGRCLIALTLALPWAAVASASSFVNFESGAVHPLALSPDGSLLFALNAPDARLAIFEVTAVGLQPAAEVAVGLEPVAVATRTNGAGETEAWVVNHLSDSVSVVRVERDALSHSRVVKTLLVGDEPRDIVFAGSGRSRAFITTARRGQNLPASVAPFLDTPGVGRGLVWVFDADGTPTSLDDAPLAVLELFGDSPRALAASSDGQRVYAAIFQSGSQTTVVPGYTVAHNGGLPPPPADSPYFDPAYDPLDAVPDTFPPRGLIVKYDPGTATWQDELARDWSPFVRLSLPDLDVFTIDAAATPPVVLPHATASGVGTVLYGMAVRPSDGKVFVTNTEARNDVRFEPLIDETHGLAGHFVENRITVVDGTNVLPVQLNPHIDYTRPTGPPEEVAQSLGLPVDLTFSADGERLYVAGLGSGRVGIFSAADLEAGQATRTLVKVGAGPIGLALDEARDRLYVLNRFEQSVSIVTGASDPVRAREAASVSLRFDPSPPEVLRGRRFLYDARLSGHGDSACASCHVFGDFDGLAWDLGNPYGPIVPNPNFSGAPPFHPMKGPTTTQSLRGLVDAGPMHWRGDRTAASDPGGDPLDEDGAFKKFNPAFVNLLGATRQLTTEQMQAYADFVLTIRYPPNPVRSLDDQLTAQQASGLSRFQAACQICHGGQIGTLGLSLVLLGPEAIKIPHLRAIYQKVGMFAQPPAGFEETGLGPPMSPFLGPQIRGFGYFHDGALAGRNDPAIVPQGVDLEAFLLVFPTGLAPAVGQQLSATEATVTDPATVARRDLLVARASAGDCDLVVHGLLGGEPRGAVYSGGVFVTDRSSEAPMTVAELWADAGLSGHEQTYTCVPPGSGMREGIDRDEDGYPDGDELLAGTSPIDPLSHPGAAPVVTIPAKMLRLKDGTARQLPKRRQFRFEAVTSGESGGHHVVPPPPGSDGGSDARGCHTPRLQRRWQRRSGAGDAAGLGLDGDPQRLSLPVGGTCRLGKRQARSALDQRREGGMELHARRA